MNADRIPMTVIALDDGEPIGTAALTEHDMETHRELSRWLGGVYVIPSARGRGVARALVRDVMDRVAAFGVPVLYLMGRDVTIMARHLA
jgi:predicted N-acetyltransferase YhbS